MIIPVKVNNPFGTMKFNRKVHQIEAKDVLKTVVNKITELLLYLTCFFPFVSFIYTGSDTQPYAAIWAMFVLVCLLLFREIKVSRVVLVLIGCCLVMGAFAITGIGQLPFLQLASGAFSYITLITVPLATFLIMKKNGWNETLVKIFIWVWFCVGFIQKYIEPTFAYSILSRHTTSSTRGVVSLATEPSAYGYMCIFMLVLAFSFKENKYVYMFNLLIQIVLFAGSSVTLIYLAVYLGMIILNEIVLHKRFAFIKTACLAIGGIGAFVMLYKYIPRSNRIGALLYYLMNDPKRFFMDGSIKLRIDAIVYSFQGFIENNGLPHGISETRIMSGVGGLFYECGFIALIILAAIAIIIWKGYPVKTRFIFTAGFMVIMISSIPFTAPLVSFYLGFCLYQGWLREQEKKSESIVDM